MEALRARNVVPHVAEYERGNLQRNSLRAQERNSPEFVQSCHNIRCLIHEAFEMGFTPGLAPLPCPAIEGAARQMPVS